MTRAGNCLILSLKVFAAWGVYTYYMLYVNMDLLRGDSGGLALAVASHLLFALFCSLLTAAVRGYGLGCPLGLTRSPVRTLFVSFLAVHGVLVASALILPSVLILPNPFLTALIRSVHFMGTPPGTRVAVSRTQTLLYVVPALFYLHYSALAFDQDDGRTFAQRLTALTGLRAPSKTGPVFESKERFCNAVLAASFFLLYVFLGNPSAGSIFFDYHTRNWLERKQPMDMPLDSALQLSLKASYAALRETRRENWWPEADFDLAGPGHGVRYSSSAPEVAEVTDAGLVTARSVGEAKIRAAYGKLVTECPVAVYSLDKYGRRVTGVRKAVPKPDPSVLPSLEFLGMEYAAGGGLSLSVGDRRLLRVNGRFFDRAASGDVSYELTGSRYGTSYSSGDPSVAAVSADGTLVALSPGKAEITARNGLGRGVGRILRVEVYDREAIDELHLYLNVDLSRLSLLKSLKFVNEKERTIKELPLSVGDKYLLLVHGNFLGDTIRSYNVSGSRFGLIYSSDNPSVAVVSNDGRTEAVSEGMAAITVRSDWNDQGVNAVLYLTVEGR